MVKPTETPSCHRPLSRASRQLFRRDASSILLHYFGGKDQYAPWRRRILSDEGDAPTSSDSSIIDPAVDKRGRRRERASLVDDPADGLSDEEWHDLLGWAIDRSASFPTTDTDNYAAPEICPLHPKHDMILRDDQNSFLMQRRYRSGIPKFGAFSLPSGRAARTAFWLEERETYRRLHDLPPIKSRQISGNSVFLFQCGICDKTFVSRYYLDKHMAAYHPPLNGTEIDSAGKHLLCPADHVCKALGGTHACVEMSKQISPYYGRGTLLGKEYHASTNDLSLPSSISSLISHLNHGGDDQDESSDDNENPFTKNKRQMQKRQKEVDYASKAVGEMRHRALGRNKLMLQAALHRQRKLGENTVEEEQTSSDFLKDSSEAESNAENDLHPIATSFSCGEKEMERLFYLCRDTMHTCFGDNIDDAYPLNEGMESGHNLANDLIAQICEPLQCHHRLHNMAGHNHRHAAHWNDQWNEYHSFKLGFYGWIVVLGVVLFYGCVFLASLGNADVGTNGRQKKKTKYT